MKLPPQGADIAFLIQVQKQLLRFYRKQSHGKNGKKFFDIQNIQKFQHNQRVAWSKQFVLRIYDQISQLSAWNIQQASDLQNLIQNLIFQLVDIMHFIFNISILWQVQNKIRSFQQLTVQKISGNLSTQGRVLCKLSSKIINTMPWKHWKNWKQCNKSQLIQNLNNLLRHIISMARTFKYTKEDLYKMYISKNRQNLNRQIFVAQYKN